MSNFQYFAYIFILNIEYPLWSYWHHFRGALDQTGIEMFFKIKLANFFSIIIDFSQNCIVKIVLGKSHYQWFLATLLRYWLCSWSEHATWYPYIKQWVEYQINFLYVCSYYLNCLPKRVMFSTSFTSWWQLSFLKYLHYIRRFKVNSL